MLNILRRLFGRDNQIDDETLAYVEGRADAGSAARVPASSTAPDEIESLKATVSLLRSVKSVKAPRSFALQHAPAPVRYVPPWFMRAPAMGAAAAVFALAVLVVGDLTGALKQSGSTQNDMAGQSSLQKSSIPATEVLASVTARAAQPVVTAVAVAPAELATQAGLAANPSSASTNAAASVDGAKTLAPGSAPVGIADSSDPLLDNESLAPVSTVDGVIESGSPQSDAVPGEGFDLSPDPETAAEAQPSDFGPPPQLPADSAARAVDDGTLWPLWQTEAALAVLALVMLAAWLVLRRRTAR